MDEHELSQVETELRSILAAANLEWISAGVDDAIHIGISSEKGIIVRQARGWRRAIGEEEIAIVIEPGSRERPQRTVVTNEPFTEQERVDLLISSIRQGLVELPAIQEDTLNLLKGQAEHQNESIGSVQFIPEVEADRLAPSQPSEVDESGARELRRRALLVLDALLAEVRG
jgi:hypothetical protein